MKLGSTGIANGSTVKNSAVLDWGWGVSIYVVRTVKVGMFDGITGISIAV